MNITRLPESVESAAKEESLTLYRKDIPGRTEIFLTAVCSADRPVEEFLNEIRSVIEKEGAGIVAQDLFLPFSPDRLSVAPSAEWPLTCVIEDAPVSPRLFRSRVWAVSGCELTPIRSGEKVVGTHFEADNSRYVRIAGIGPVCKDESESKQTSSTLARMEQVLAEVEMNFGDVVRTWFFNRDILSWYPAFNHARNAFFREKKVFDGWVPASTGIGGSNPSGCALAAGLLAIRPKNEKTTIRSVPSPLQNSALDYGSSFSRAVEIAAPGVKRLIVSGTASIDDRGETVHRDDIRSQIDWTLHVVRELLESREMSFGEITDGHLYFRDPEAMRGHLRTCEQYGVPLHRMTASCQTICRGDLLFEIELSAMKTGA